jgi:hypothetical protein
MGLELTVCPKTIPPNSRNEPKIMIFFIVDILKIDEIKKPS